MGRRTAALTGSVLMLTAGLVTIPPAAACGCGDFALPEDGEGGMDVVGEQAILSLVDGTQRVQIALDADSDLADAALVVPTPTPATAALGDAEAFDALAEISAPQREEVSVWWPDWGSGGDGAAGAAPGGSPGVDVFQEVTLGPLEVASLGSADLDGLLSWLDERGYALSEQLAAAMGAYVEEGWSFVAIKLSPEGEALDGEIPPVDLTFASDELVYPMRLSAAADVAQQVRTYVVADRRMDRADGGVNYDVLYAGPLGQAAHPALETWGEPFGQDAYVTAVEQTFVDPAADITSDFMFAASEQGDVQRTYRVEVDRMVGPILAGPAFVAIGMVVLGAVGTLARVARRRRTAVKEPSAAAGSSSPR
ncbi:DUF2330 domain-containing protein [Serinibacter arcticus]|uniref:DUF2330 domain-containing protein n=1 Tax=Serinibacter arcticus TaxID=1655435 RepID=A0A4Z1DWH1_9MICO|nr:DUF2330 domain-containing protein [Serinibacter arcticus]TGO03824.1 hypothetical protein SERN_2836 [Serinibacter arcticus]